MNNQPLRALGVHPDAFDEFGTFADEFGRPADLVAHDAVVAATEIDRYLSLIEELQAERAEKAKIAAARKATIDAWLAVEDERIQNRLEWLAGNIRALEGAIDYRGKKSYQLPHGTIGRRLSKEGIEIVDSETAQAFAEAKQLGTLVRKFGKTELYEYYTSSGEIPDGCEIRPESDRFYIKTAEGQI